MFQSLVKVDTDIVDAVGTCHDGRVETTASLLTGHLHQRLYTETLVFVEHTLHTSSTNIGLSRHTTGGLDGLRETEILGGQGVVTFEEYLTKDLDVTLGLIARALTHIHLIVRLESKAGIDLNLITLTDGERERLGNGLVRGGGGWVTDTARHIDTGCRGGISRTSSLENQVLDGLVVSKLIGSRELHLTMDGHRTTAHRLDTIWDKEFILVLQRHVGHSTGHNTINIDRDDTTRTVSLHAMQNGTSHESLLRETSCILYQGTNRRTVAQIVHTRMEDSTRDRDRILVTAVNGIDDDRVAIL